MPSTAGYRPSGNVPGLDGFVMICTHRGLSVAHELRTGRTIDAAEGSPFTAQLRAGKHAGRRRCLHGVGVDIRHDKRPNERIRADGESSWATMATKDLNGNYIAAHRFSVQICEDHAYTPDYCSALRFGYI